jgi:peroxiredoxin
MTDTAFNPVTDVTYPSVTQHLAALHAHRIETMAAVDLHANIGQRHRLEQTADRCRFVTTGDPVEPFELDEVHGGRLTLDGLTADGPAVLVFFRFAGCPACNIALPHYQRELHTGLLELGARLVAVSPQPAPQLVEIKDRHDLRFDVASDPGNTLARRFGITFTPDEESRTYAQSKGFELGTVTGTVDGELPMPTVVIIDQRHTVRFADVHPDWLVRTEADEVLTALRSIRSQP